MIGARVRLLVSSAVLLAGLVASPLMAANIAGTIFEDPNYGGGAGRTQAASAGIGVVGVRVELYDGAGNFVGFVASGGGGAYAFTGLGAGNYTVRVVNGSVPSSRPGWVPALLPVQTYRTDASSGVAVSVTDRVGGEVPSKVDAGNGATTLAALTTATTTAQSIAPVLLGGPNIGGVDFGFNFNTIVNVNNSGQGSLRQFLINSNTLTNAGLAIVGQTAGKDVSIFMISDGQAHPGLRAGLANLLNGFGVAVVTPTTMLDAITDNHTSLDATTQTVNVGDTNAVTLGAGGKVGVNQLDLSTVPGPELEIANGETLANGLRISADFVTIRGLAVCGFNQSGWSDGGILLADGTSDALIEQNVIGSKAHLFMDPGATSRSKENIFSDGADNARVQNNLIGFGGSRGILLQNASNGWEIEDNEFLDNSIEDAGGDGIALDSAQADVTGNLIVGSASQGVVLANSSGSTFTNNTIKKNGIGTATASGAAAGMTFRSTASSTTVARNQFIENYAAGLSVNNGATGIKITRNSFRDNGTISSRKLDPMTNQIAIDLNNPTDDANQGTSPFRTRNDNGDGDAGGNNLLNFPVLVTATITGGNLVLTGFAPAGAVIEIFVADPDPLLFGEGLTHKISLTEGGTGVGGPGSDDEDMDDDNGTGSYSPPTNGIDQGAETTNRFSYTFTVPPGINGGTQLTATATKSGETSEFSGLVTVSASYQITGRIYEDVNGDAGLGDGSARSAVTLHLYQDDGDDVPDGDDIPVGSTTTDGLGDYTFPAGANTTYWVVVDSTTVSPTASLNAPFAATHAWAEQTYGPVGAWCADGAGGDAERGSAGPCYAGRTPGTSDVAAALTTAQHVARVPVATSNVGGIDFGFSFKVISNTAAATEAVVDTRSAQGSLDQALANANALAGGDSLRVVPALAPNDGSGNWWQIDYTPATDALESILDAGTVVDGTAYCAWNDGTQGCLATTATRDTNTAGIGANVAVGINDTFTTPALDPELEIVNEALRISQATAPLVPHGTEIRNISLRGDPVVLIEAETGATSLAGLIIEDNVVGSPPNSFTQPGTLPEYGIRINSGTACRIRDNLIGYAQRSTLNLGTASTGCVVTRNEIRGSGKTFNTWDAILLWALPSTIEGNLITDSESPGIDTVVSGGGHTLTDNTITLCGQGGAQTMGIRLVGTGSVVERNVIQDNTGPGILATGNPTASVQHRISDNEFGGNGGPGIDLVAGGGDNNVGDGITLNDGTQLGTGTAGNACGIVAADGNNGLDFPIIDSVMLNGDVAGRACAGSEVEIYTAAAGAGDTTGGTDHGEGVTLLGATTANGSGDFSLNVGALMPTDELTAIAIDGSNNTSEFSANVTAEPLQLVKRAFQLDGTPIASGSTVPTGTPVRFLLYIDNPGSATLDIRIQEALDPLFTYQASSIQVDNSYTCVGDPCNAADEAAILAAVEAVTADCHGSGSGCTDSSDTDVVRYDAAAVPNPKISAGGAGNAQLNIAAGKVWATAFTVRIQ